MYMELYGKIFTTSLTFILLLQYMLQFVHRGRQNTV